MGGLKSKIVALELLVKSTIFGNVKDSGDLDTLWKVLKETMVQAATKVFSKNWYIKVWSAIDVVETSKTTNIVLDGVSSVELLMYLLVVRRSILECPFCKIILNHLMVDNTIVVESNEIKLKIDKIMERWIRKWSMLPRMSDLWSCQYMPLNYMDDDAFSGVIKVIDMRELSLIVNINTKLIALIETAQKILFKIFSDQIFLACSKFNILHGNNFLVLKSISTQFLIFAIGLVVEDVLKKNKKLWLVLQNMHKVYDLINRINRIITDFGLLNVYRVHNNLDQDEIKKHKHLYKYKIDIRFMAKSGRVEAVGKKTSFLAAGTFVNNTIWIENCQTSTQHILNIVNEFFEAFEQKRKNNKLEDILAVEKVESKKFYALLVYSGG
ncbi:hypothetical protein G9A89_007773 [Geosiphon pyriformis]|nr:hypothetical protein G9A89_007773 [Geosiphon pyriformis]